MPVGEVQRLNAGDLEALAGVAKRDRRDPRMCVNRDARTRAISLIIKEHAIRAAAGGNSVVARAANMEDRVATSDERPATISRDVSASSVNCVVGTAPVQGLVGASTSSQHVLSATGCEGIVAARAADQSVKHAAAGFQ